MDTIIQVYKTQQAACLRLRHVDGVREHRPKDHLVAVRSGERAVVSIKAQARRVRREARRQEGPWRERTLLLRIGCASKDSVLVYFIYWLVSKCASKLLIALIVRGLSFNCARNDL